MRLLGATKRDWDCTFTAVVEEGFGLDECLLLMILAHMVIVLVLVV